MDFLRNGVHLAQLLLGFAPVLLCSWSVEGELWWALALAVGLMFVLVRLLPLFRKRENLWMFLLAAVNLLPLNLWISRWFLEYFLASDLSMMKKLLWGSVIFGMSFSTGELALGILTRMLFPRQMKNGLSD